MSGVTKSALRVYAALSELRRSDEDILDALVPFFEPIPEVTNGKIFDPRVFAFGVQRLYRWRFTKDIAEQFIPRLQRKGFLERQGRGQEAVYIVRFTPQSTSNELPISEVLSRIIDEFEQFPPKVNDLLNYFRTRDELTDILIRFLVTMDAYDEVAFANEVQRLRLGLSDRTTLATLEEGGRPLEGEDRYMCARFVQHICRQRSEFVTHLSRLASIGLLTEVVEDFLKPVQTEQRVNLTVVVDAPLALDFLGCSGNALKDDVKSIFDALRGIGCSFVVFPVTCSEMKRNLESMLALTRNRRFGYTHEAMARGEVLPDFVEAVARNPEAALEHAGIQVKPLSLEQFPNSYTYFDQGRYEDFLGQVNWVQEVAPREHDATCMTLLMRLRAARHSSDLFRCGYVFVTRNPTFVRESRAYCLTSRLITSVQQGPVIHQRQLATLAWLRTGLGADETIPRSHLLAACDRILRVRLEVREAVAAKLRQVTPEKIPQFELLLLDHRSVRKLADESLNDERVITTENAEQLLEAMRKATIEEERQQFEIKLRDQRERHTKAQRKARDEARSAGAERDAAIALVAQRKATDEARVKTITAQISRLSKRIEIAVTALLLLLGAAGVINFFTEWLQDLQWWKFILAAAGLYGLYSLLMTLLERPKLGLATLLNWFSRFLVYKRLAMANLSEQFPLSEFELKGGQVTRKLPVVCPGPEHLTLT